MSRNRFSPGTRFRWQKKTYEVKKISSVEKINIRDIIDGEETCIEIATLAAAHSRGELSFVHRQKAKQAQEQTDGNSHYLQQSLADYPDYLANIARYRLQVIQPLLDMDPTERTGKVINERVAKIRAEQDPAFEGTLLGSVSRNSIYSWIGAYIDADRDIRALVPNTRRRGGVKKLRLNDEVNTLIDSTLEDLYKVREEVTISDVVDEIACRIKEKNETRTNGILLEPSRSTVFRHIQALDVAEQFAIKHGRRAAKQQFSQYKRMEYPDMPTERVEIDHTRVDAILIDDQDDLPLGRPTITLSLDTATRYPLGYYMGFEPPSYLAVMECLYHSILPKESLKENYGTEHDWIAYGLPSTLVIDNGREFIGKDLNDACLSLGIILQHTPVRTPHLKPAIERSFGSLNSRFFHTLPGTTFSNPQERGDYNSLEEACVYTSDVDEMLNTFMVDVYAESFHKGLNGVPARRWEEALQAGFLPALPDNISDLQILLGRVAEREVWSYGIAFESLRYNCTELVGVRTKLKGRKTKIKYHPGDLSCIYVYDPFDQRYIKVPSLDEEYTQNLSLWKHRIIRDAVLQAHHKVDAASLGRAKRKIREKVQAARERKKISTRTRLARWETSGKPLSQISTSPDADDSNNPGTDVLQKAEFTERLNAIQSLSEESLLLPPTDEGWEIAYSLGKANEGKEGEKNG